MRYRSLRKGYTTGTCAAAAARGALLCLLGRRSSAVDIDLPCGQTAHIATRSAGTDGMTGRCSVVKDGGDDPDVTNGAVIEATVQIVDRPFIRIRGGSGVGVVTRPGLAVPPGRPAINPVPRAMIRGALKGMLAAGQGAEVTIGVEDGEELAAKTLNPRLGITGGISILGTTGIVEPYSHEAYRETITCALDVARAMGLSTIVFSTGRSSEKAARRFLKAVPEPGFVLMADYFSFALRQSRERGFSELILACFPGKLLKFAAGAECTHCAASSVAPAFLAEIAQRAGVHPRTVARIARAQTVRHAFSMIPDDRMPALCADVARMVKKRVREETASSVKAGVLIVAYDQSILFCSR